MKVDVHQNTGLAAPATGESNATLGVHRGDANSNAKVDALSQDRLELSGLIADIAKAEAAGAVRRAEYVKAMAKLHRTGAYAPDAAALSRKLIQHALAGPEGGNGSD